MKQMSLKMIAFIFILNEFNDNRNIVCMLRIDLEGWLDLSNQIANTISTAMSLYVLFESAIGFGLFELKDFDEANASVAKIQKEITEFESFCQIVRLKAFYPFESSLIALAAINSMIGGKAPEELITFLSENFPIKKKAKVKLGLSDNKVASSIGEALQIKTFTSAVVTEIMRGLRSHLLSFLKLEQFSDVDLDQSRLGLAHTFSRNKIALDINRQDKPIIQSIGLLELLDKDINTFVMRIREWYSWHYPQLAKIVADPKFYVQLVAYIANRATTQTTVEGIEEIVGDDTLTYDITESLKNSMGQEISTFDMECLVELCAKTLRMMEFRTEIQSYLKDRMDIVSPNLTTLLGETIAAKLIAHSGSLSSLAKYPASTIQILGAEKALFRALKQKSNTPKYGLLYNTSFIGRAIGKKKGQISRFLANKCAIAARLDHFLVMPTNKFGERLKEQVEEKLVKDQVKIGQNEEIMDQIMDQLRGENLYFDSDKAFKRSIKKKKSIQKSK